MPELPGWLRRISTGDRRGSMNLVPPLWCLAAIFAAVFYRLQSQYLGHGSFINWPLTAQIAEVAVPCGLLLLSFWYVDRQKNDRLPPQDQGKDDTSR